MLSEVALSEVDCMTRLILAPALAVSLLAAACAPAPLYSSSGLKRGAATLGEIPRDARGEPVWDAIRPLPEASTGATNGTKPDDINRSGAAARSSAAEAPGPGAA